MSKKSYIKEIDSSYFIGNALNPVKLSSFITIVKFYTPWCRYCIDTIPVFDQLVDLYKDNKNVTIAQYNCDNIQNKNYIDNTINKFAHGYKVDGYPTIIIFKNNAFKDKYNDKRDIAKLSRWIDSYNTTARPSQWFLK